MTYTGKTRVGGPAQVHELGLLSISKLAVGPMDNNCYLLRCRRTGEQLLIDAAAELKEQQRRDQEAGQHEEDIDAEKAATRDGNATVVEHHRQNGEGPQSVQGGAVRQRP